jgi:hypothetical protein
MADNVRLQVDLREFQKAMREYIVLSEKTVADAVNDKAGDVAFKSIKYLPPFDKGTVPPYESGLFNAIATGNTKFGASRFGVAVKRKGNAKIAKKIRSKRLKANNYSKSLFLKLAAGVGKKVRMLRRPKNAEGRKAVKSKIPTAYFEITGVDQEHADKVLTPALEKGIAATVKDMRVYIERKLAKIAKAKSGRRR